MRTAKKMDSNLSRALMSRDYIQVAVAANVGYSSSRPSRSKGSQGNRSQRLLILAVEIDCQRSA